MLINSLMQMTLNARSVATVLLHIFVWSFLGFFTEGDRVDIGCLKSIKESLEGPGNNLSSWNFENNTEGFICNFVGVECWHLDENRVLNIRLSNMGLKGQFPRGIENCSSLTGLDLSNNELHGTIPTTISKALPFVTSLDLSSNNFSGEIPVDIANCSYLNILMLNNNRLTGSIPLQIGLLNRIKMFSVANNLLTGPVPTFFNVSFAAESYANNLGLCGKPLDPCVAPPKHPHASFVGGFVVGYVIAILLGLVVFLFCLPNLSAKRKMTNKKKKKKEANRGSKGPTIIERSINIQISTLERQVTRMNFADLNKATDNFNENNVIGLRKTGTMYKAMLPNGWFLAVKRLHDSQLFEKQFTSELMILGRLRHNNLVPILGFCIHLKERLLVYKYMSNGSLYDRLHPTGSEANIMDWPLRVKVAFGLARGLAWLHYNSNFRVVHLNICSKCILLDQNFEPKISNFGDSMFMNLNDTDSSRSSLVNSEFWELGIVKKDVYSFGLVLLELVTGKDPSKVTNSSNSYDGTLNEWVTHLSSSSSSFYNVVDESLIRKGFDGDIFEFLRVAFKCVQRIPDRRPTMLAVYKTMRAIGERYGLKDYSEILVPCEIVAANSRAECIELEITENP